MTSFAAKVRQALVESNPEMETAFYVLLTEAQALDIASGYVPNSVKAMVRTMLDWQDDDRRLAARPIHHKRKKEQ